MLQDTHCRLMTGLWESLCTHCKCLLSLKMYLMKSLHKICPFNYSLYSTSLDILNFKKQSSNLKITHALVFRLAGYAPFYHRQQLKMMRMIQEGRFDFPKDQWDTVSGEAKDLVLLLFKL